MSELTFRPITAADETDFYAMAEEFFHSDAVLHPIPAEYHRRTFAEMMRSDQYLSGYIFQCDDAVAGFSVTNRMMQHEAGGVMVWVEDLYIRPAYRGQGLGSRSLQWLEEQLRGDAVMLRLETEPENERAQALYRRLGYESLGYLQMIKRLGRLGKYLRQYRTKSVWRLCTPSACKFPVIFHKNAREYIKYSLRFLFHLTKNLMTHLSHNLCAVLP